MSDYIKREDAITAIDGTITIIGIENAIAVRQLINQFNVKLKIIPPADVVEVVRCKDCTHRDTETMFCHGRGWPMSMVSDDGYCDKGERK